MRVHVTLKAVVLQVRPELLRVVLSIQFSFVDSQERHECSEPHVNIVVREVLTNGHVRPKRAKSDYYYKRAKMRTTPRSKVAGHCSGNEIDRSLALLSHLVLLEMCNFQP